MEEEAREILTKALSKPKPRKEVRLGTAIRQIFAPIGGVDLPDIPREPIDEPPDFGK